MAEKKSPAAKKPAPAAPAPAAKAAPAPAPAAKPAPAAAKPAAPKAGKAVTPGERWRMVAEAAYFLAEKRGFAPGNHDQDWAEAERQIDAILKKA